MMSNIIDKDIEKILKSALSPEDTDLVQLSMELAKEAKEFQTEENDNQTKSNQIVQKVLNSMKKRGLIKNAQQEAAVAEAIAESVTPSVNKNEDPSVSKHVNPAVTTPTNADEPIPPNKTDVTEQGISSEGLEDIIGDLGTENDTVKDQGGEVDVTIKAPSEDVMVKKIVEVLVALGVPEDIAQAVAEKTGKSIVTEISRAASSAETAAKQTLPSSSSEIKDVGEAIGEALDQMEASVLSPVESALESEPTQEDIEKVASLLFNRINPYYFI